MLFSGLSFQLGSGELLQIAGANGAGKTTLLRILCGLIPAAFGSFQWRGRPVASPWEYSDELAWIGHRPAIREALTPREMLDWYAQVNAVPDVDGAALLDEVGLSLHGDIPCRQLSAGQRRRVALAMLQMRSVDLWVLDEPFTALDRSGTRMLGDWIARHTNAGGSVLLTTHQSIDLPVSGFRVLELGSSPGTGATP